MSIHLRRVLLLAVLATPVVVFTVGCMLPGCGGPEDPPDEPAAWATAGTTSSTTPAADSGADTADSGVPACLDDGDPSVAFTDLAGDPLGPDLALRYGSGGCGADGGVTVGVEVHGLLPGPVDVAWSLELDGEAPVDGDDTWDLGCDGDVHALAYLSIDLPRRADGESGVLRITLVDADGVEVEAVHAFVASVDG